MWYDVFLLSGLSLCFLGAVSLAEEGESGLCVVWGMGEGLCFFYVLYATKYRYRYLFCWCNNSNRKIFSRILSVGAYSMLEKFWTHLFCSILNIIYIQFSEFPLLWNSFFPSAFSGTKAKLFLILGTKLISIMFLVDGNQAESQIQPCCLIAAWGIWKTRPHCMRGEGRRKLKSKNKNKGVEGSLSYC